MAESSIFSRTQTIFANSPAERTGPPIRAELWKRSIESSLDFIEENIETALVFDHRSELHAHALTKINPKGLLLEFGVYKGHSVNALADALKEIGDNRPIYGFDSFLGLEEDWSGHAVQAGTFNLDGNLPDVRENVHLVPGWVNETVPEFLANQNTNIALAHIDTDTYTPCKLILKSIKNYLTPGSVLVFDELLAYPGWKHGEYKALIEEITIPYEFIAFSGHHAALVMR